MKNIRWIYLGIPFVAGSYGNGATKVFLIPFFNYPFNLSDTIFNYADEWLRASTNTGVVKNNCVKMLNWMKPPSGTHKLNVDGSRTRDGDIRAGGVIRDETGSWCGGFMVINIGAGEVL